MSTKKRDINKDDQVAFFKMIQATLPDNVNMASIVSDYLGIGINAAYVRMRGEKELDFGELIKLCRYFGISIDSFIGIASRKKVLCEYRPLRGNETASYLAYVHELAEKMLRYAAKPDTEICILAATDIPAFGVIMFPELAIFRHFTWCNLFSEADNYELFSEAMLTDNVRNDFNNINKSFRQIPSSEIWSSYTIDTILQFIGFHYDMGHFARPESALLLCNKMLELVGLLEEWAISGQKGEGGTPFKLYISDVEVGNTFIHYKTSEEQECWIKLFTTHGISITDKAFCSEVENWLNLSIQRATLVSGTSSIERHKFFNMQRQRIETQIERIK